MTEEEKQQVEKITVALTEVVNKKFEEMIKGFELVTKAFREIEKVVTSHEERIKELEKELKDHRRIGVHREIGEL